MQKTLKTLAILSTIGILLVILAGAVVTKTGSGDGCGPNWPLCHGQLWPTEPTIETVIEYTHRLVTGIVGILVFIFSIWTWVKYRNIKEVKWMAIGALFFLILQSIMGALAVVFGQSAMVMALHFGFSLLSYATLFLLLMYVFQLDKKGKSLPYMKASSGLKWGTLSLFIYTYIVVYLGAYVRHTSSSLACEGWPLCNGEIIPSNLSGQVGVQFLHRVAALLLFIGFIILLYYVYKKHKDNLLLFSMTVAMFILIVLQVLTGAWVVTSGLGFVPAMLHALIITLLFGILSYVLLYINRGVPKEYSTHTETTNNHFSNEG